MRAESIPHVEYELLHYILDEIDMSDIQHQMVPNGDTVAQSRYEKALKSISNIINNAADRRKHKLPENHEDFEVKE